mgnify:CR=1 FL=1
MFSIGSLPLAISSTNPTIILTILYKKPFAGENYAGFQIQANANTVQAEVEKALSTLFGEQTKIVASGRTDTGVSAKGQIFHFESASCNIKHQPNNNSYHIVQKAVCSNFDFVAVCLKFC